MLLKLLDVTELPDKPRAPSSNPISQVIELGHVEDGVFEDWPSGDDAIIDPLCSGNIVEYRKRAPIIASNINLDNNIEVVPTSRRIARNILGYPNQANSPFAFDISKAFQQLRIQHHTSPIISTLKSRRRYLRTELAYSCYNACSSTISPSFPLSTHIDFDQFLKEQIEMATQDNIPLFFAKIEDDNDRCKKCKRMDVKCWMPTGEKSVKQKKCWNCSTAKGKNTCSKTAKLLQTWRAAGRLPAGCVTPAATALPPAIKLPTGGTCSRPWGRMIFEEDSSGTREEYADGLLAGQRKRKVKEDVPRRKDRQKEKVDEEKGNDGDDDNDDEEVQNTTEDLVTRKFLRALMLKMAKGLNNIARDTSIDKSVRKASANFSALFPATWVCFLNEYKSNSDVARDEFWLNQLDFKFAEANIQAILTGRKQYKIPSCYQHIPVIKILDDDDSSESGHNAQTGPSGANMGGARIVVDVEESLAGEDMGTRKELSASPRWGVRHIPSLRSIREGNMADAEKEVGGEGEEEEADDGGAGGDGEEEGGEGDAPGEPKKIFAKSIFSVLSSLHLLVVCTFLFHEVLSTPRCKTVVDRTKCYDPPQPRASLHQIRITQPPASPWFLYFYLNQQNPKIVFPQF
ncbi:hypothetical protein T439DRAFT_335444 [Meredithblackwellia eburnea MCA 4105]